MTLLPDIILFLHVLVIICWLGFDFIVFWLSMSLLKRELPPVVRLDRAHLAEVIDRYVLYAMLITTPLGAYLAYIKGWPLMATPWLSIKLIFYGVVILMAIMILTGAAGTKQVLQRIADGEGDREENEARLRKNVIGMAPYAIVLHVSIAAMVFIALARVG